MSRAPKMKNYSGWEMARPGWNVCYPDGRSSRQVSAAIRAPSKRAAKEALGAGWSMYSFNQFWSETGNKECIAELDKYPPLTLIVKGNDSGITINGKKGWTTVS